MQRRKMTGEYKRQGERERKANTLPRTSVVLLLLMIVAELPFTLSCHPTLRLHHLFYFIWASLVPLRGIEALRIAGGGHSGAFELAHRVVSLGAAISAHARVCHREFQVRSTPHRSRVRPHTVVGIGTTHHHGHRVPARGIPQLPALDEIVDRTINLFTNITRSANCYFPNHTRQTPTVPRSSLAGIVVTGVVGHCPRSGIMLIFSRGEAKRNGIVGSANN